LRIAGANGGADVGVAVAAGRGSFAGSCANRSIWRAATTICRYDGSRLSPA
jgi:hypothetical protein